MKKTYIIPRMEVVEIEAQPLMETMSISIISEKTISEGTDVYAKQYDSDLWDLDEDQ